VCDLETSRMGAPYVYDISRLRVKQGQWHTKPNRTKTKWRCNVSPKCSLSSFVL